MARGRVSLSGSFSPRFFMDFCSRGGGVRSAQRCPDRLRRRQALGRGTGAQAGPRRQNVSESARRSGETARLGKKFWGFSAVSGGAGAAERTSADEQTSGGTWRKKRSAALERKTEEARRIRQRAQPDVSGLSDGGAPGACDGQCIPGDEKFSPPCLKCRTREDEAPDGAADGLFAGRTVCVFCRGVRHGRFPCSRGRLRRSVRFFHQGVGPEHSASQAARAALWRSGEIRGVGETGEAAPERGSCAPAGSGEGFGKAVPPAFLA